jgi:hypothetical protein
VTSQPPDADAYREFLAGEDLFYRTRRRRSRTTPARRRSTRRTSTRCSARSAC